MPLRYHLLSKNLGIGFLDVVLDEVAAFIALSFCCGSAGGSTAKVIF
ncbi:hypothetical protein PUG81_21960 [Erwiniaceae bacterium L1_54_6]|nr:hypothetical protein [Pantoea cypripedii]MDF7661641.1 hypothetical protein [Erwiniaceae bacterium L1_54_6]